MIILSRGLLLLLIFSSNVLYAKDYVLNFESSCFRIYGDENREQIINDAMGMWNNIEGAPARFIRGEDIDFEIDETNFDEYVWDTRGGPVKNWFPFSAIPDRELNPIVCDSNGVIMDALYGDMSTLIHGAAGEPVDNIMGYTFFHVIINEYAFTRKLESYKYSYNQTTLTNLIAHELGHIIEMNHLEAIEDAFHTEYPLMYRQNFREEFGLSTADIEDYRRAERNNYSGVSSISREVSFEAEIKIDTKLVYGNNGTVLFEPNKKLSLKLKTNIPVHQRRKEIEFYVLALVEEALFIYYDKGWHDYKDLSDLHGDIMKTTSVISVDIFNAPYDFVGEVSFYWGYKLDGKYYVNAEMPTKLITTQVETQ